MVVSFGVREKQVKRARIWIPQKEHQLYLGFDRLTFVVNMGWERILPLKIYNNFKTWKQIMIFLSNDVISISRLVKNYSNITLILHLCEIA